MTALPQQTSAPSHLSRQHRCFLGLIACAVVCDGKIAVEEIDILNYVSKRHKFLSGLPRNVTNELIDEVIDEVNNNNWRELFVGYLEALPDEWQAAAFFVCLDVVMADAIEHQHEIEFIDAFADKISLPDGILTQAREIFRIKNGISG